MLQLLLQTRLISHFINTHVPRQRNLLHLQFFENSLRNLQILNILKSLAGLCNIIFGFWCIVHELDDLQQRSILAGTVWPITQSIFLHEVLPCPPCLPQVPQLKRSIKKNSAIFNINVNASEGVKRFQGHVPCFEGITFQQILHATGELHECLHVKRK